MHAWPAGSNDPDQSLIDNLWTDKWSMSPLASFRDFIVPSYRELQVRTRCFNDENRSLSRQLEAVKSLLQKPQTLLKVRHKEPKEAQAFVAKTDALSTADVLTTVSPLNEDGNIPLKRDHKQNQKGDLNGKQAYEQLSVAEFQLQQEYTTLRALIDRLENENESLKRDLRVTESELANARNLSQIRAEEPQGAQSFLDKADVLSTTDIVEKVNILNNEISQTASLLVDLPHNAESHHQAQRQPTEMTNWMLGEKLARDLYELSNNPIAMNNRRREPNRWQLLFLVVFHIAITKWCSIMVNSWVPNDRTLSDSIASIYSGIRQISE